MNNILFYFLLCSDDIVSIFKQAKIIVAKYPHLTLLGRISNEKYIKAYLNKMT